MQTDRDSDRKTELDRNTAKTKNKTKQQTNKQKSKSKNKKPKQKQKTDEPKNRLKDRKSTDFKLILPSDGRGKKQTQEEIIHPSDLPAVCLGCRFRQLSPLVEGGRGNGWEDG